MFMARVLQYLTNLGIRRLVAFWFRQQTPFLVEDKDSLDICCGRSKDDCRDFLTLGLCKSKLESAGSERWAAPRGPTSRLSIVGCASVEDHPEELHLNGVNVTFVSGMLGRTTSMVAQSICSGVLPR
jgi:hypothetical protein